MLRFLNFKTTSEKQLKTQTIFLGERFIVRKIARVVEQHPQALILSPSERSTHLSKKVKEVSMGPTHLIAIELKHLLL